MAASAPELLRLSSFFPIADLRRFRSPPPALSFSWPCCGPGMSFFGTHAEVSFRPPATISALSSALTPCPAPNPSPNPPPPPFLMADQPPASAAEPTQEEEEETGEEEEEAEEDDDEEEEEVNEEADALLEHAQAVISRVVEQEADPNPRLIHTLAYICEEHEASKGPAASSGAERQARFIR